MFHSSAACLEKAVPCSLNLMNLLEYRPTHLTELWKASEYDHYMIEYVEQAAYVTTTDKKIVYAKGLRRLITTFDNIIIKHLKSVLTLVIDMVKVENTELRVLCVQCLALLVHHGWPRITAHSIDILLACVNVAEGEHGNAEVLQKVCGVVGSLRDLSGGSMDYYLEKLRGSGNKGAQALASAVLDGKKEGTTR